MNNADFAAGASASLKATINELMNFLGRQGTAPPANLRDFLYGKLCDLAVYWYRRGLNRGHTESYQQTVSGKVPRLFGTTPPGCSLEAADAPCL